MKRVSTTQLPVDTAEWSEESRERRRYVIPPATYKDKIFSCRACKCESVFTAEQQKHEYEVKKSFVLSQDVLCPSCFSLKHTLQEEEARIAQRWSRSKSAVTQDSSTLRRWLELLEQLPMYGIRRNHARVAMLKRLIESAA